MIPLFLERQHPVVPDIIHFVLNDRIAFLRSEVLECHIRRFLNFFRDDKSLIATVPRSESHHNCLSRRLQQNNNASLPLTAKLSKERSLASYRGP
jgi:hypothetical protein